jgi:hypothetical protein
LARSHSRRGKLAEAGITTAQQVADADPKALAGILGVSEVRAMSLVDSARRTLSE